jgi:predicted nucleic acid-binding Zn ribbon protein
MMRATRDRRRVRSAALLWMAVALVFYVGYIAVSVYRSRH